MLQVPSITPTTVGCFLYSVNSLLAHYINEEYYNGEHYVWCAPLYDSDLNPPSSNPKDIYIGSAEKGVKSGSGDSTREPK